MPSLPKILVVLLVTTVSISATNALETDFFAGSDAYKRGDYEAARQVWLPLAEKGDAEAQFRLARLYVEGKGVDPDDAIALGWYRRAAAQEHARAQASLGFMLHTGRGGERNLPEAIEWYRKAAEQGRSSAQRNLGQIYLEGQGVPVDAAESARWFSRAADRGNASAMTSLGRLYEQGLGVERDPERAFKLYKKAANDRDPDGEFHLARVFENGIGTRPDIGKALRYFERASNQGHAEAQAALDTLISAPDDVAVHAETAAPRVEDEQTPQDQFERGRALLFGDGVAQDTGRAEDWLRRAAEGGHGEAAYRLGLMYYRGGTKNWTRAYVWFVRAAERGIADAASWRDRIYDKLNGRERAEAERLLGT